MEVVYMRLKHMIAYAVAGLLTIGVSATGFAKGGGGNSGKSGMETHGGGSSSSQGLEERKEKKGVEGAEEGKHLGTVKSKHKHKHRHATPATPAKPATPAVPAPGTPGAKPAVPATPAKPATPPAK